MRLSVGLLVVLLVGCGGPPVVVEDLSNAPRTPEYRLEGDCAPSAVSSVVQVASHQSQCLDMLSAPRLIQSAQEYDALFDLNCEKPAVDFTANRVLIVPARGANEWFVFTNFVNTRSDALEIGLVIRPQGALPPDSIVVLPKEPARVDLRWCRSVCVKNCDVAIP